MHKRFIALVLSVATTITSLTAVNGLTTTFMSFSSAYAADNSLCLDDGEYIIPIKYTSLSTFNNIDQSNGNDGCYTHLSPRAILNITEDKTYLTLGVENWSLYDVFVPVKQSYLSDSQMDLKSYPNILKEKVSDLPNVNKCTNWVDGIDDAYMWSSTNDPATKYADIYVDNDKNDSTLDVAYVTFEIEDYNNTVSILRWNNQQTRSGAMGKKTNFGYINLMLDVADYISKDELVANASSGKIVDADGLVATDVQEWNANYLRIVNFTGYSNIRNLTRCALGTLNDDGYNIRYYINEEITKPDVMTTPNLKNLSGSYVDWLYTPVNTTFSALNYGEDENGVYYEINYKNDEELIFGKYVYVDYESKDDGTDGTFVPVLSATKPTPINLKYTVNGEDKIWIDTDSTRFYTDKSVHLRVVAGEDNNYYSSFADSLAYKKESVEVYTVYFEDEDNNPVEIKGATTLNIKLPDDFNMNDYFTEYYSENGTGAIAHDLRSNEFDLENKTWSITKEFKNGYTFALMKNNKTANVNDLETGVYSINVHLRKYLTTANMSMANGTVDHDAYIVVDEHGNKTLYMNFHDMAKDDVVGLYLGDIFCDNISEKNNVYKDSTKYLKFLTNDDGSLANNCDYDAITEWGCVERAVISLRDESYSNESNSYIVAIASPMMAAISGTEFENCGADELQAELIFFNPVLKENMNENDVKALYPYDISALTRQVELAKLKIASKKSFSTDSIAKVQKAYDEVLAAFGSTYDPLNKAEISADKLEELGTNLENAIKALDGITVAGYNAQLDKDVTFDFYLSMNKNNLEAAQDGDLTANITKADGSTETVEVGEDGKIEFNVAPKEIGQTLKVKIGSYEFTYSVQEYLEKLIWYAENPTEGVEVSEKDAAIAKSLLVYGGYAQDYFVKKDAEANAYVDTERAYANVDNTLPETADNATTFTAPQLGDSIKYYGAAVVFDYTTDIRLYFTVDDAIENHSFAVNDKAVDAVAVDGGYYIAIENIYANQLGNPFKITVDGTDFQYGVYNYIAAALNATEVKSGALNELQALVKALYQYAELTKTTA